jgi:1-acyl-sn-glycerol-3-phosphate acyltransferase
MQATRFQNIIITSKIIIFTLVCVLWIVFLSLSRLITRTRVDALCSYWSRGLLKITRTHCKVLNPLHVKLVPGKTYILMSNHCSHYDIPLILMAFPKNSIRMIAKKELFRIPLFGYAMKRSEFIAIDREHRTQAHRDLQVAQKKMASGIAIWIAPEGTRSRSGKLQPFKKGGFLVAVESKATIIPIGIHGSANILPPKTSRFGIGEKVEIHIGEPIATKEYDSKSIRVLMAKVEESIRYSSGESCALAKSRT